MTTQGRRRRASPIQWVMTWGLGGLLVAILAGSFILQRYAAITQARNWMVEGPACPIITRAQFQASGQTIAHSFEYYGARYGRAYGYVNCDQVRPDWFDGRTVSVCQFNSPTILEVKSGSADVLYASPVKPMTVWMTDQGPHCVLAASVKP